MNSWNVLNDDQVTGWFAQTQVKVDRMLEQMGDKCPHVSVSGIYDDTKHDWWTSGFWPGILWILYDMTGNEKYREAAWSWDETIELCFARENRFHHDVGFQFLTTAVIKYKLTGFNPAGGFLRAWNQPERPGWSIIDTMMNLSILFWASRELNDPRFAQIAKIHADTVMRHSIREDGAAHHITVFDPESGAVQEYKNGQGYSPTSSWSRGQAWALYGMANVSKYTGEAKYLKCAQRVANYYISCLPEDHVAHWDFRVPELAGEPRDTSAASCAASGLIEIAKQLPAEEGRLYREAAEKIIRSLSQHYSTFDRLDYEGILLEGTGSKPSNSNVNVSLIYGDYYYVEALSKLNGWKHEIF
jgi:unsaturated chondroitin disaccharide hydrolase